PPAGGSNMVRRSHHENETVRNAEESTCPQKPRDDRRADLRGRAKRQRRRDLPQGRDCAESVLQMAAEGQRECHQGPLADEAGAQGQGPREGRADGRDRAFAVGAVRGVDRAAAAQKKRGRDLHGSLKGRHLTASERRALVEIIDEARASGESVEAICAVLEVTPRAYYRWRKGPLGVRHGGGGGWNKLTPAEEKKIVAYAKK